MNKITKSLIAVLSVSILAFGISGCKDHGTQGEDTGKKIDQTIDNAGQNINSAVDKAGQKIEKAGKSIENTVKDKKK